MNATEDRLGALAGKRLRALAEGLTHNRPETVRQAAASESLEARQTAQRLRNAGQAYLQRVMDFVAVTQMHVYHELSYSLPGTGPGFTLHVGRSAFVQARLRANGWQVTTRNVFAGLSDYDYPSDEAFLQAKDELLEPLVAGAIVALAGGAEEPDSDARGC